MKKGQCEVCGRTPVFGNHMCRRHYDQVRRHGKILDRTIYDANEYVIYDDYAEIVIYNKDGTEKARTKVSLDKIELCKQYKIHESGGYAIATIDGKKVRLHRLIMGARSDEKVDHMYHDTLDNRTDKLRKCTNSQNQMNMVTPSHNTSGCKGVFRSDAVSDKPWTAQITVDGKTIHLGYHPTEDDAMKARTDAEVKYYGDFRYVEGDTNERL